MHILAPKKKKAKKDKINIRGKGETPVSIVQKKRGKKESKEKKKYKERRKRNTKKENPVTGVVDSRQKSYKGTIPLLQQIHSNILTFQKKQQITHNNGHSLSHSHGLLALTREPTKEPPVHPPQKKKSERRRTESTCFWSHARGQMQPTQEETAHKAKVVNRKEHHIYSARLTKHPPLCRRPPQLHNYGPHQREA